MNETKIARRSIKRRAKFTVAILAVTAAFAGGTQALAPTSASALIYQESACPDMSQNWLAWATCEYNRGLGDPRHSL